MQFSKLVREILLRAMYYDVQMGGGGDSKSENTKGGCVYLVLWISPKCGQGIGSKN